MNKALTCILPFAMLMVSGCNPATDDTTDISSGDAVGAVDAPIVMNDMPPVLDDADAHPEHGPHGGELVELGREDFHIEVVDGPGAVALYVLDRGAVTPVPIDAATLTVSLKHYGEIQPFELAADPQSDDPAGRSSRFTSVDQKLVTWIEAEAEGVVVAQIDNKSYTGRLMHDHHGHSH